MLTWVCTCAVVTLGTGSKCTRLSVPGHRYIELFLNSRASPPPGAPVGMGRGAPVPRGGGAVGGVPRYPAQSTWTDPRAQVCSIYISKRCTILYTCLYMYVHVCICTYMYVLALFCVPQTGAQPGVYDHPQQQSQPQQQYAAQAYATYQQQSAPAQQVQQHWPQQVAIQGPM